jgi:hypothetical protein
MDTQRIFLFIGHDGQSTILVNGRREKEAEICSCNTLFMSTYLYHMMQNNLCLLSFSKIVAMK